MTLLTINTLTYKTDEIRRTIASFLFIIMNSKHDVHGNCMNDCVGGNVFGWDCTCLYSVSWSLSGSVLMVHNLNE